VDFSESIGFRHRQTLSSLPLHLHPLPVFFVILLDIALVTDSFSFRVLEYCIDDRAGRYRCSSPQIIPTTSTPSTMADHNVMTPTSVNGSLVEKPFRNASVDGASRNEELHSSSQPGSPSADDPEDNNAKLSAPMQKRRRVTRACDECRRKKIKCDGKQPCTHCTVYSYGKRCA
jgi:hypothetical protein